MSRADSVRRAGAGLLIAGAAALAWSDAEAEEAGKALAVTVNPSRYEDDRARLDRMLERRLRQSDFMFRHICRGCGAAAAREAEGPFNPQATLNGAPPPNRVVETVTMVPAPQPPGAPAAGSR